jgi:hypothetical protein
MELPSTENYEVVVCKDDEDNDIYGIRNKETRVVEYKDSILSRTYFALENIEENHGRMVADINGEPLIDLDSPTPMVMQ